MPNASDGSSRRHRLGVVSYLNAKPLTEGLDANPDLVLTHAVPAALAPMLDADDVDVALVPVIDLVGPGRKWKIISDACIGCDGETLTVRVFSNIPASEVETLYVDGDSHTSVALAQVIWLQKFGRRLNIVQLNDSIDRNRCNTILLIGDKVITSHLPHLDIQIDLGSAWKSLTGLPFVFAAWAADQEYDAGNLDEVLTAARDEGVRQADRIARDVGPGLGWPVELAQRYLTHRLRFTITPRHKEGLTRFITLAQELELVPNKQELVFA
jgi:chorismate dehydratase